jgi:hypothetical protein
MGPDALVPLAGIGMIVAIVALKQMANTVRYYLDWRMRLLDRQGGGDRSVLGAIQELRAEIAALKQHETEAVLSFDSTLQTLDARVKHLERQALSEGGGERLPFAAGAARLPAEARVEVAGAAGLARDQSLRDA